jgi:hypothetical protein
MTANALQLSVLDSFRSVWICWHLDYLRAAEALETAMRSAEDTRRAVSASMDDEQARRAHQSVESARRHLAAVEQALGAQFDRFCGVTR